MLQLHPNDFILRLLLKTAPLHSICRAHQAAALMPEQQRTSALVAAQIDSFRSTQNAIVHSCQQEASGVYAIRLSDTVLYPEGGGQPADLGTLMIHDAKHPKEVNVTDVQRRASGVLHYAAEAVQEGAAVQIKLDWGRRFDHMQMHTGQHLLSAVVDEIVGADTVSWEMHSLREDEEPSSNTACIDLPVSTLKPQQLQAIEDRCNRIIQAARPVTAHVIHEHDQSSLLASLVLRGQLPSWDKVGGELRLLEIEGVDMNACGGTHLRTTAQIQVIKLVGQEKARGGTRLTFLAGGRAMRALSSSLTREARLNKVLGCGVRDHEAAIMRLQDERKQLARAQKALLEELATAAGQSLAAQLPSEGGCASYHREGVDLAFLTTVAAAVEAARPQALVLLTASAKTAATPKSTRPASNPDGCFLLTGPAELVTKAGQQVAEIFDGKGGGRGRRYQGKGKQLKKRCEAKSILQRVIDNLSIAA